MMLTAEEYVCTTNAKNQKKYEWVKVRERNEALDCRNYARAAAALLGYDRMKEEDFENLEQQFTTPLEIQKQINDQKRMELRRRMEEDERVDLWNDSRY